MLPNPKLLPSNTIITITTVPMAKAIVTLTAIALTAKAITTAIAIITVAVAGAGNSRCGRRNC